MIAAVAGTFNILHDGHKALIDRAFSLGDKVYIGITSDRMASSSRNFVNSFYVRRKAIEDYVSAFGKEFRFFEIDDIYGPGEMMEKVNVLIVSQETLENGKKVVKHFSELGTKMELSIVDIVQKKDGSKLSSTDIVNGVCSRNGDTEAIDIAVGSLNPVKIEAVRSVMERIYGQVRIFATDAKSGVPEQPFGEQTPIGAKNRAKEAINGHTLSVGIEAGVFEMFDTLYDIQYCAILDRDGRYTIGTGSGFRYPDAVVKLVRKGMTVGEAMKTVYKENNAGKTMGAIGILSKGLLDRKSLTEQSILAAMLPRIWDER